MKSKQNIIQSPLIWLVLSLTLGLAPFLPEPHVWEKLKWILAGAKGMRPIDWFDFVLHGTPWLLLIISVLSKFKSTKTDLTKD